MPDANVKCDCGSRRDGEPDQHAENRLLKRKLHLVRHALTGPPNKPRVLAALLPERFDHPNRANNFLHHR